MFRLVFTALLGGLLVPAAAWAQQSGAFGAPQRAAVQVRPAPTPSPSERTAASATAKPPEGKEGPAGEKPAEKPDDKQAKPPSVIRRQSLAQPQGNPAELSAAVLDSDGRVAFQFRNQGWPELIDWLAELADQPLDWQELPDDRVNITTPGRYTVPEVVDLLNRHLLGRGFTLLALDGGMTVVKCATLNPAIVPRVAAEDLHSVPPHSFVRTSLDVGWLSAEKLAEELKPMISENGKLTALTTTNRIEAIDAAITLRQIADLLAREQNAGSRESLVPEFKLRHIPADEAKRLLEQFLGVSNKPEPVLTPQQIQQAQQMQQMRSQQSGGAPAPEPKKPAISIVANSRQNSVLIQAPPDRVVIATEFLKRIDVPGNTLTGLADIQSRVQVFRLVSLDPEKLIEIVQEMNVLEPTTRIRVDAANRALIVSGSAADRFIIDQLITRLDGSGRRLEVLQLRRLEAADVAESISFLMGTKEKEDDSSRSRYPYYFGSSGDTEKKKEDEFRVAANTRFRQVLLWATEAEMTEVRNLLVKLGELPPPGGSDRVIRVIDADVTPETFQYLRGLEQQWRRVAPNALLLPDRELFAPPANEDATTAGDPAAEGQDETSATPKADAEPKADTEQQPDSDERQAPQAVPAAELMNTDPAALAGAAAANPFSSAAADPAASTVTNGARRSVPQPLLALTAMQSAAAAPLPGAADAQGDQAAAIRSVEDFDRAFLAPQQQQAAAAEPGQRAAAAGQGDASAAEPIRIELDAAGNLILSSSDTAALDQLENIMLQFAPPKRAYHVFTTKYASALWVSLNLEDYFKEEDDEDDNSNSFSRWYYGYDDSEKTKTPEGLGRPAKLRFIADVETGTIVVSNASADQLRSIEELIELWDVPEPANKRTVRYTRLVALRYGKSAKIAETIKETYRDLLSSNDKAFQQARSQQGGGGSAQKNDTPRNNSSRGGSELIDTGGGAERGGGADFSFKGKLSLGIDELGNTLLVSAEGEPLLELVCDMIDQLDKASMTSDGVQVINLPASINAGSLEMALRALKAATAGDAAERPKPAAVEKPPIVADGPDG